MRAAAPGRVRCNRATFAGKSFFFARDGFIEDDRNILHVTDESRAFFEVLLNASRSCSVDAIVYALPLRLGVRSRRGSVIAVTD
jgi:hypothetical protein